MQQAKQHILENLAEYYVLFVIVLAIPISVALLTSLKWGVLLSFVLQAIIGVLYIKGSIK